MAALWRYLEAHLSVDDVVLFLAVVGTFVFSALAVRAQVRLRRKIRRVPSRREQQQAITDGSERLR